MRRLVAMLLLLMGIALPATAQEPPGGSAPVGEAALEALREAGNTVIVVPAAAPEAAEPATRPRTTPREDLAAVRMALEPIFAAVPTLHIQMLAALQVAGDGSLSWLLPALGVSLAALLAGTLGAILMDRTVRRIFAAVGGPPEMRDTERLARALGHMVRGGLGAAAFAGAGLVSVILMVPAHSPEQVTGTWVIVGIAIFLAMRTMLLTLLAPRTPPARLLPFDDRLAGRLHRQTLAAVVGANLTAAVCFWMASFPLAHTAHQFMLLVSVTTIAGIFAIIALAHRRAITAAVAGDGRERWRRMMAALWLPAVLFYIASGFVLNVGIIALSVRFLVAPTLAPLLAAAAGLLVAGVLIIAYDRTLRTTRHPTDWTRLFHNTAVGAGTLAGVVVLTQLWPFARYTGLSAQTVAGLGLLLVASLFLWRAVVIFVEERLAQEEPADAGDADEGMGAGATRLATLLPIFRNTMLFLIAAVALAACLASLGVNVAPLFAGAGVLGIAIGFGAQALIRDIFSGAFFLLDDAFRRGEYVDVGGTTGAVERISVRSFQLRHHEGALHTIPFGEIKQLTNFSRDWVVMKLPLRVTYETDVERVRKLIKKLGQAMATDPEIGPKFLEPLKSQGVIQMEDSAMIVRVKFKTRPGDQFIVRRHVFTRIRALFEAEGIHFAHREVTVRVAGEHDEETRRRAALAAAREAAEPPGKAPATPQLADL